MCNSGANKPNQVWPLGIRAIPTNPANSTTKDGINSAILRYDGAPEQDPLDLESDKEKESSKDKRENDKKKGKGKNKGDKDKKEWLYRRT